MKKILLVLSLFVIPAMAIDGLYIGGQVGQVLLQGNTKTFHDNAFGFGVDLGIRTQSYLDVTFQSQMSSHSGDLKIYSETIGANVHFGGADFDFSLGMGPGAYILKSSLASNTYFGLHGAAGADILISDELRIGMQGRYHFLFDEADDYWTLMARIGYQFDLG